MVVRKLSLRQKAFLALGFKVFIGWDEKRGLPLYAFKCNKHGVVISYPSGFNNSLKCRECIRELKEKK